MKKLVQADILQVVVFGRKSRKRAGDEILNMFFLKQIVRRQVQNVRRQVQPVIATAETLAAETSAARIILYVCLGGERLSNGNDTLRVLQFR